MKQSQSVKRDKPTKQRQSVKRDKPMEQSRRLKRGRLAPFIVLATLLLCSLWNARAITTRSRRLLEQLDSAERYAHAQQWTEAARVMESGYQDWRNCRTYLHIVSRHDASNGGDALYRRCVLFARAGDEVSFLTELETLREQLRTLTEMEQFSIDNIL